MKKKNTDYLKFFNENNKSIESNLYKKNVPEISDYSKNKKTIDPLINLRDLIETIDATKEDDIKSLRKLLKAKYINYSEFVSYWAVFNMSYSIYEKLSLGEQKTFLRFIVKEYKKSRDYCFWGRTLKKLDLKDAKSDAIQSELNKIYLIGIQSRIDSAAHKRSSGLGENKIAYILTKREFDEIKVEHGTLQKYLLLHLYALLTTPAILLGFKRFLLGGSIAICTRSLNPLFERICS